MDNGILWENIILSLGEYYFNTGDAGYVKISSIGTHGTVIADAIKFVYKDANSSSNNSAFFDLNCDNKINLQDFAVLLSFWSKRIGLSNYKNNFCLVDKNIDLNLDGIIDGSDIGILLSNWSE